MLLKDKVGPGLSSGGRSQNNGLFCLLVSVTLYSTLGFEKTFSGLL